MCHDNAYIGAQTLEFPYDICCFVCGYTACYAEQYFFIFKHGTGTIKLVLRF